MMEVEEEKVFVVEVFRTYVATLQVNASSADEAREVAENDLMGLTMADYEHCQGLDDLSIEEKTDEECV